MTKAFEEFKQMVNLNEGDTKNLYLDLVEYQEVCMNKDSLEGRIMAKVIQSESVDEVKYIGLHSLAGSDLDKLIKSRIDYLEGRTSEYELYLEGLKKDLSS